MPSRFDRETLTRAKVVRLVKDHVGVSELEWAVIRAVSVRWGTGAEALRQWLRRAEVDAG